MKSILMSIQPKWCELIARGKKKIEVRKTAPKMETPFKVYIYCTNGQMLYDLKNETYLNTDDRYFLGENKSNMVQFSSPPFVNRKVIGEFVCDKIYDILPHDDGFDINQYECGWKHGEDDSCLTFDEFRSYLGINSGYGLHISQLKIYDKPKELGEFEKQNPCYYSGSWEELGCWERGCVWKDNGDCDGRCSPIERPPQSWMYVEELKA